LAYKSKIDWSSLAEDYGRLGSLRAVAEEYGTSSENVRYMMIKLGIDRKFDLSKRGGNSRKGREAELFMLSLLPGAIDVSATDPQAPFDLMFEGKRVNVKSSKRRERNWVFRTGEACVQNCDVFACVLMEDDVPYKVLMIPSSEVPLTGITIPVSEESKYMKYKYWERL